MIRLPPNLSVHERLRAVAIEMPKAHPAHEAALLRIVVEVAYLAAERWVEARIAPSFDRPRHALALVKRWLEGDAAVSVAVLFDAADAGYDYPPVRYAARAAVDASRKDRREVAHSAAFAVGVALAYKAAEKDLDRLLLALNLEVPRD